MATLIRVMRDFDKAEDALQDALAIALESWPRDGVPQNPAAWITTTARRRAIDRLRREQTAQKSRPALTAMAALAREAAEAESEQLRQLYEGPDAGR